VAPNVLHLPRSDKGHNIAFLLQAQPPAGKYLLVSAPPNPLSCLSVFLTLEHVDHKCLKRYKVQSLAIEQLGNFEEISDIELPSKSSSQSSEYVPLEGQQLRW
jgi:hypothetical protein